jgi:hypothetical protein
LDYFPFYDALVDFLSSSTPVLSHALLFYYAPMSYGGTLVGRGMTEEGPGGEVEVEESVQNEWTRAEVATATRVVVRGKERVGGANGSGRRGAVVVQAAQCKLLPMKNG